MTKRKALSLSLVSFIAVCGCSTVSVRVMPGENGVNKVVVRDIERESAEEESVKAANKYCEKRNQEAVFVDESKTKYTGSMDEDTRKTVRKASTAAMVLGGVGGVASRETMTPGAVLGSAGVVGHVMTNDRDYEVAASFKCK